MSRARPNRVALAVGGYVAEEGSLPEIAQGRKIVGIIKRLAAYKSRKAETQLRTPRNPPEATSNQGLLETGDLHIDTE